MCGYRVYLTIENEFDDEYLQSALEESLRLNPPKRDSPANVPRTTNQSKSIVSSRIKTVDHLRRNDDDDDDDDDRGIERRNQLI